MALIFQNDGVSSRPERLGTAPTGSRSIGNQQSAIRNILSLLGCLAWLMCLPQAQAQGRISFSDQTTAASISGQFQVSSVAPQARWFRALPPNTNVVQLKTTLLAVSAERFKTALWRQLGLPANASWSGKIYLRLHPAAAYDETVTIASTRFLDRWDYAVDLPDMLRSTRYARALSGVLLLEYANRHAGEQPVAEVPAWLVDGLAQEVLATAGPQVLLSAPRKLGGEMAVSRINRSERGFDSLAAARRVLQNTPALTFDQLSWPTGAQMDGADGGVYLASAQLFQSELLTLKNGREKLRAMLADLPAHLNWQTAFFHAFGADFQRPLDVEKWWALRQVNFVQHAPGPSWTWTESVARLEELTSVLVETRGNPNVLPDHAEVSLQVALRTLQPGPRDDLLRQKVLDLGLCEFRLAPPLGGLADGYRVALADFLGENPKPATANKRAGRANLMVTLKRLDQLDVRRRKLETHLNQLKINLPDFTPANEQPH